MCMLLYFNIVVIVVDSVCAAVVIVPPVVQGRAYLIHIGILQDADKRRCDVNLRFHSTQRRLILIEIM